MKKLVVLAMLAAFVLGTVGMAQAVEIKAKGTWRVNFNYLNNAGTFNDDTKQDEFQVNQRMRTLFEFVASENLKGVLHLEIGNLTWGAGGGALNADGTNVKTKNAYIQFMVPGTEAAVKAGIQGFALPSTYGSHILSADVAALAAIIPFNEMMGLTVAYARPYDLTQGEFATEIEDEVDVFAAVLPINLDGVKLNPFAVYARWGKDFLADTFGLANAKNANQFFGGINFSVDMLDPIVFLGDFNYGTVELADNFTSSGFVADLAVQYRMDMMTPELFFLYETGEDSKYSRGGDSDRMPTIGTDGASWAPTAFGMTGSAFGGGVDGILRSFISNLPGANAMDSYWAVQGTMGMMAGGFKLGDISFIDKLTHDLIFLYAQGTNDTANVQLFTEDDKYYEVTFDNNYQIYENLVARLELGWGKLDLDKLNVGTSREDLAKDSAWKAAAGFIYKF